MRRNSLGRILTTTVISAAMLFASGVATGQPPGGVVVTPGGNGYGIGVYAGTPGSPGSTPQYTDMTAGGGQPAATDVHPWTQWSNEGVPYICNPADCVRHLTPSSPPQAVVDPFTVAQELVTGMQIRRIDIGIVPEPADTPGGRTGLIGMPVWLWDETLPPDSEHTRGPITRTATTGALTVNATAVNTAIVWNLGDGGIPVVCPMPAVNNMPYQDVFLDLPPITMCGRVAPGWAKTSIDEPGGVFQVTATSLWVVTWSAVGPQGVVGGTFPLLPTASTTVRVGEMQVLGVN